MITTSKTIWCDGKDDDGNDCTERIEQMAQTNQQIIEQAREAGWAVHSGGHYCPKHNSK